VTETDRLEPSIGGAALAAGVAFLILLVPIAVFLFGALVATTGCLYGTCENARPNVPLIIFGASTVLLMLADIVLWGIAGYRRMPVRWVMIAGGVLLAPVGVLTIGHLIGAF